MSQVYMVRLDVKRYYDELRKSVVRDALRLPLDIAFERLTNQEDFASWFTPYGPNERNQAVLDWLLDQSFGTTYYDPASGETTPSPNEEMGIPQGPILSAWLATVALFPMDQALQDCIAEFNSLERTRAGFARYVDDIVLLADSEEVLGALRAAAENAARSLQIELVSKETVEPMTPEAFALHLTEGRALAVSGPVGEITLLPAGDGDLGWHSLSTAPPKRYAALQLLRDQTLYAATGDRLLDQIRTALHSDELRPSELGKAARWVWYWAAGDDNAKTAENYVHTYWRGWLEVTANVPWVLDPEQCAWDDPAFYALEGVEKLLESAHWGEDSLSFEDNQRRVELTARIARIAKSTEFISLLSETGGDLAPQCWGLGVAKLQRMFWQRAFSMRWKAARLTPWHIDTTNRSPLQLKNQNSHYRISLRRAQITDAETCAHPPTIASAQSGQDDQEKNILREAFLWLHDAFVRLGADPSLSQTEMGKVTPDPLLGSAPELNEFAARAQRANEGDATVAFLKMLRGLLPNAVMAINIQEDAERDFLQRIALATFVAITPRARVVELLSAREQLLPRGDLSMERLILPPLPGVPTAGILAVLVPTIIGTPIATVESVEWFSFNAEHVTDPNENAAPPPVLFQSSPGSSPTRVEMDWSPFNTSYLRSTSAKWTSTIPAKVLISAGAPSASRSQLKWTADVFEALARLNHDKLRQNSTDEYEYVATWSNLAASHWYESAEKEQLSTSLICSPVSAEKISGMAFVRDGSRGLKSYDIQKENGKFWRIGVALTDVLGFVDELDRYSALEIPEGEAAESCAPDRHLLRNVLRKLRGHYSKGEYLPRRANKPHMPATLDRSLQLLRNFPSTDNVVAGIAYVLACEMETRAMSKRFAGCADLNLPGGLSDFLHRTARDVSCRMPLSWSKYLPNLPAGQWDTWRAAPLAWTQLLASLRQANDPVDIGWDAYIYGLEVLVITEWLRAVAFELETDPNTNRWALSNDPQIELNWGIETAVLCNDSPASTYQQLLARFSAAIKEGRSQASFDFITPIGWLIIVAGRTGLLDIEKRTPFLAWSQFEADKFSNLARFLSQRLTASFDQAETENEHWPFENLHTEANKTFHFEELIDTLKALDEKCGLRVTKASAAWRFDPQSKQFTDASGETWSFPAWRIAITEGFAPEEVNGSGRILRSWTETRCSDGALVSVSARGKRLAVLLAEQPEQVKSKAPAVQELPTGRTNSTPDSSDTEQSNLPTLPELGSASLDVPPQGQAKKSSENLLEEPPRPVSEVRELLNRVQSNCWTSRKMQCDGHVRVAIMQWDVADSYRHPIYDISLPDYLSEDQFSNYKKEETKQAVQFASDGNYGKKWTEVAQLPSWAEYRRRRLLEQVLRACQKFSVNLLVLPEYSVRPETVGWLRNYLQQRQLDLNIIAGTYRLFGNASELGFIAAHQDILGTEDYSKFIQNPTSKARTNPGPVYSWERSAMLTLLAPIKYQDKWHVASFSRAKKYASNAADECINPRRNEWEPLFSVRKMLDDLSGREFAKGRATAPTEIPAANVLPLIVQSRNLQFLAELVCSELFLPMSPINYSGLASEYQKLVVRFGGIIDQEKAGDEVLKDVKALASHLGISPRADSLYRRTILIVPAMSSRSADYWCFGQAAILAGGVTTVFCNAVADKLSVGGSCFIGRKSWEFNSSIPGIQPQTPYHGWSRGIFYNSKDDALGKTEQAVVIADIDPANMNEGRPRQQALPVPLQLVAYLPIAETIQKAGIPTQPGRHSNSADSLEIEKTQYEAVTKLAENLEHPSVAGKIVDPSSLNFLHLAKGFSGLLGEGTKPFVKRLQHWEKHWRDQPFAGPPPALVDWLWVDLTPEIQTTLPLVFVPPWTEQDKPVAANRTLDGPETI